MTDVKLGVIFPTKDIGTDSKSILEFGPRSESLGLDFLVTYDHVVGINRAMLDTTDTNCVFDEETNIHEAIVVLAAMAATTKKIRLVSGCLVSPQRNTLVVAKQSAELDIISGGRLDLGVSIGWNEFEFLALGADYSTRARRLGSQIGELRSLWLGNSVAPESDLGYGVSIKPLPYQQPIPIWVGGLAQQAVERAAVFGDGWLPLGSYDDLMHARMKYYFEYDASDDSASRGKQVMGRVNPWATSHAHALEELNDWVENGATHIAIGSSEHVYGDPDYYFEELRVFMQYARKNMTHPGDDA